jgi:hypothetical protein
MLESLEQRLLLTAGTGESVSLGFPLLSQGASNLSGPVSSTVAAASLLPVSGTGSVQTINAGKKYSFTDSDGDPVTVALSGKSGSCDIHFLDSGNCDIDQLVLNETNTKSKLTIKTKGRGAETTVNDILVNGSLGNLSARTTDLLGDLTVTDCLKKVQFQNIDGEHTIQIGGPVSAKDTVKIVFVSADNLTIDSDTPIASITGGDWDTGGIIAPSIGKFTVNGTVADVDVAVDGAIGSISVWEWTSGSVEADSLNKLGTKGLGGVAGDFGAVLTLNGELVPSGKMTMGTVKIIGALLGDCTVHGSVKSIALGQLEGDLVIDGDASKVRIYEELSATPPADPTGVPKLHIGGTARVTGTTGRITFENGDVYVAEGVTYGMGDITHFGDTSEWWQYDVTYSGLFGSGSESITMSVGDTLEQIGGHDCSVVSYSVNGIDFSTAWFTDAEGTHLSHWNMDGLFLPIDVDLGSLLIAPSDMEMNIENTGDGTLNVHYSIDIGGDTAEINLTGSASVSSELLGGEQITVPAGTYMTTKLVTGVAFTGNINMTFLGQAFDYDFTIGCDQTAWCSSAVGIVKAMNDITIDISGIYNGSINMTLVLTGHGN